MDSGKSTEITATPIQNENEAKAKTKTKKIPNAHTNFCIKRTAWCGEERSKKCSEQAKKKTEIKSSSIPPYLLAIWFERNSIEQNDFLSFFHLFHHLNLCTSKLCFTPLHFGSSLHFLLRSRLVSKERKKNLRFIMPTAAVHSCRSMYAMCNLCSALIQKHFVLWG